MAKHKFVILIDGELKIYKKFDDIPDKIDNVIEFLPAIPQPPHTPEQHIEMSEWNNKLKELMRREKR